MPRKSQGFMYMPKSCLVAVGTCLALHSNGPLRALSHSLKANSSISFAAPHSKLELPPKPTQPGGLLRRAVCIYIYIYMYIYIHYYITSCYITLHASHGMALPYITLRTYTVMHIKRLVHSVNTSVLKPLFNSPQTNFRPARTPDLSPLC